MNKETVILLGVLVLTLQGCGEKEESEYQEVKTQYEIQENSGAVVSEYSEYLRKIWVDTEWNGDGYEQYSSFYFCKIENGEIEGKIAFGEIAEPEFQLYKEQENEKFILFTGTVEEGVGKCHYTDEEGTEKYFEVKFVDDDNVILDSIQKFRPYHLNDIVGIVDTDSCPFGTEWCEKEEVYFTSVQLENESGNYPDAYFSDSKGDVFYHFTSIYQKDSEIINVSFEDKNTDGLDDVTITTAYPDEEEMLPIERSFIQQENGDFSEEFLREEVGSNRGIYYAQRYVEKNYEKREKAQYEHCEKLVSKIQEALRNNSIEELLQTGTNIAKPLTEHEIQNLCYLENRNILVRLLDESWSGDKKEDSEWYVIEQSKQRIDIMFQHKNDNGWDYVFFRCGIDENGRISTPWGMITKTHYGKKDGENVVAEYYFLEQDGLKLFCVPERDDAGAIQGVTLYTFDAPDYWGAFIYIEKNEITEYTYEI